MRRCPSDARSNSAAARPHDAGRRAAGCLFVSGGRRRVEVLIQAMPAVISAATLAVAGFVARKVTAFLKEFQGQHDALMESQRNQLKASIVREYEECEGRGYITPMELDTLNRRADSYFRLGGNQYIHAVMRHANEDLEVRGSIPD